MNTSIHAPLTRTPSTSKNTITDTATNKKQKQDQNSPKMTVCDDASLRALHTCVDTCCLPSCCTGAGTGYCLLTALTQSQTASQSPKTASQQPVSSQQPAASQPASRPIVYACMSLALRLPSSCSSFEPLSRCNGSSLNFSCEVRGAGCGVRV